MKKLVPTFHILSKLGMFFAFLILIPTIVSFYYDDKAFPIFWHTAAMTELLSCFVWFGFRKHHHQLRPRGGF